MSPQTARRDRLREMMSAAGVRALLVTDLVDVQYLCGFSGSNGALLVTDDSQLLATDGRYEVQAARECPDVEVAITRQLNDVLLDAARNRGIGVVGFDPSTMSVAAWRSGNRESTPDLEPAEISLEELRKIKDPEELAAVQTACEISVRALERLLPQITIGMSELELARQLELLMGLEGAQDRSFDTIVATGPNSAVPHHHPTGRQIAPGDLLKIDFGALYEGYHADCTRTFVVAAEPEDWQAEIHGVVLRAQQAGIEALAPGRTGKEIDAVARTIIDESGFAGTFGHGLGHGVGLQIHEVPFLSQHSTNTVEAQVPLTVEPGIYLPGRGGVRIEDTMIVGASDTQILTQFPRELTRVG